MEPNMIEWRDLMAILKVKDPIPEYKVLLMATEKIKALEAVLQAEHEDCIRIATEVLPEANLFFAHQTAWALNAEVKRLLAENVALRKQIKIQREWMQTAHQSPEED